MLLIEKRIRNYCKHRVILGQMHIILVIIQLRSVEVFVQLYMNIQTNKQRIDLNVKILNRT